MKKLLISFIILLISTAALAQELHFEGKADEATNVSDVLGRTVCLEKLCDNFEDPEWHYDYSKHECYRGFWKKTQRGEPELIKRVTPPKGGKCGSIGALEIRTNKVDKKIEGIDDDDTQEDLQTADFKDRLGRELTRADQPVFIVRVWLPPFDQWGDYYSFGFRHRSRSSSNNSEDDYYPSIWLQYNKNMIEPHFFFRVFFHSESGVAFVQIDGGPITEPGWWTLAIAYDEEGIEHYYARPGVGSLTEEEDKKFDATQFRTEYDSMVKMLYSFFSLGYPEEGNTSPRFVIDDYEVWVVKDKINGNIPQRDIL